MAHMKHTTCNNIQSNRCNSFSLRYYFSGRQCAFFWFVLPLRKFIFDESIWAMRCTYVYVCMLIIVSRIMSTFILEAAAHSQEVSIIYSVCPSLKTSFLLLVTRQMLKSKLPPPPSSSWGRHCWPSGEPEKCLKFMYLIRFVIRIKF